jgi:hypothetical protein
MMKSKKYIYLKKIHSKKIEIKNEEGWNCKKIIILRMISNKINRNKKIGTKFIR